MPRELVKHYSECLGRVSSGWHYTWIRQSKANDPPQNGWLHLRRRRPNENRKTDLWEREGASAWLTGAGISIFSCLQLETESWGSSWVASLLALGLELYHPLRWVSSGMTAPCGLLSFCNGVSQFLRSLLSCSLDKQICILIRIYTKISLNVGTYAHIHYWFCSSWKPWLVQYNGTFF